MELRPAAHRADVVVVLDDGADPVAAVVVEIQRRRDEDKPWAWPEYLAAVRRWARCPTVLLVVCLDTAVARWAAGPLELDGGRSRVVPHVLGPEQLPVLTDPVAAVRGAAWAHLEELMETGTFTYESEFTRRLEARGGARGQALGEARGEVRGEARMLLRILEARNIAVPAAARERISSCTDLEQLEAWGDGAATVDRVEDLFR